MPPPQSGRGASSFTGSDYQRIARAGLRGGIDDALETAGSIAGSSFGPFGALGGGLLARGLGGLLGLGGGGAGLQGGRGALARGQRGESPAQPVYVVMPGVSELLSELVSLTRAAQLRSAGHGIDALTHDLAVQNARVGLRG